MLLSSSIMNTDFTKIFTPSETFLKAVGKTQDDRLLTEIHSYESINLLRAKNCDIKKYIENNAGNLVDSTFTRIAESLTNQIPSGYIPYDDAAIDSVLMELMWNSFVHSPAETGLHITSFYGKNFGIGLHDGGEFYKQDWVKKSLESKVNIVPNQYPSELNLPGTGTNRGIRNLYKYCDFLEVDTTKGVLYLTVARGYE